MMEPRQERAFRSRLFRVFGIEFHSSQIILTLILFFYIQYSNQVNNNKYLELKGQIEQLSTQKNSQNKEYAFEYILEKNQQKQSHYENYEKEENDKKFKTENQNKKQHRLTGKISQSINLNQFESFELIYEQKFSFFAQKELQQLLLKIDPKIDPLICIGAEKDKIFKLVGCDLASEVFQETQNKVLARQSKNGNIFWYYIPGKSFGFSPHQYIELNVCDVESLEDDERLCLSIKDQNNEGRIGKLTKKNEIKDYNIKIYKLKS